MGFRFLHTADLHLDAPLKAIALRDPDLAREVGVATRRAFSRLIDLCIEEKLDFLLIAGDLWDGSYSSTKTPRFLKQELLRLREAGIRCYLIRGNHDAMARQTGELDLPDNARLFGRKASTERLEIGGQQIAIHGLSFHETSAPDSLLPLYPSPQAGAFNIGMMHTSLNGSPGHDNYAPCSLGELQAHGYDYWALGHIHRRSEYRGASTIVMPGTPQGRDIGEAGETSVTLVSVGDDRSVTTEARPVACLIFERLELEISRISDWSELLTRLDQAIREAGRRPRSAEHLVLRPVLRGATPLSWRITRDLDRLSEEARAFAGAAGLWIDKIVLHLTAAEGAEAASDLPAGLVQSVLQDLPQDPALQAALEAAAQELLRDLPPDLRDLMGEDEASLTARCQELLAEGAPLTLAALSEAGRD